MYSLYGIENPLVDRIIHIDEAALALKVGEPKGSMILIDERRLETLLAIPQDRITAGGSCANTVRGFAWLAGAGLAPSVYGGAVGADESGVFFRTSLERCGVQARLATKKRHTGVSSVFVTPDRERTLLTHLGACQDFVSGDIDVGVLRKSRYFHSTGYMFDTPNQREALQTAVDIARSVGVGVSFDAADSYAVRRYRDEFLSWIPGHVDLLFANREEMTLLTGEDPASEDFYAAAARLAPLVVVKLGSEGAAVLSGGARQVLPAYPVVARDTTGAGDSFAAGFLCGLIGGRSAADAACLGNKLASLIVTVDGCSYEDIDREVARSVLD